MFIKANYLLISFLISLLLTNYKMIENKDEYGILDIPTLNLSEKIYPKYSKYNDLKYGLYLLPDSTDLENERANIIIASHSGNAKISYFKNLDQLKINDEIKINTGKETYLFRVIDIYEDKKDGDVVINRYNTKTLSLVTCKKNTNNLHLIITAIYSGKLEKNSKNTSFFDKIRIFLK